MRSQLLVQCLLNNLSLSQQSLLAQKKLDQRTSVLTLSFHTVRQKTAIPRYRMSIVQSLAVYCKQQSDNKNQIGVNKKLQSDGNFQDSS